MTAQGAAAVVTRRPPPLQQHWGALEPLAKATKAPRHFQGKSLLLFGRPPYIGGMVSRTYGRGRPLNAPAASFIPASQSSPSSRRLALCRAEARGSQFSNSRSVAYAVSCCNSTTSVPNSLHWISCLITADRYLDYVTDVMPVMRGGRRDREIRSRFVLARRLSVCGVHWIGGRKA
jgi:hypothetical protein